MAQINLAEEDIEFLELWYTPKAFSECMFHDWDNFAIYKKGKFGELRLYQQPMISDEPLIDFEMTAEYHNMGKKQEFQMRKMVGDLYCFGARRFGKTKIVQELELLHHVISSDDSEKVSFSSVDKIHLDKVLGPLKTAFSNHKILKKFLRRAKGSPDYYFEFKNGVVLNSINFNIGSTNPGQQWFGSHSDRIYIEEASLETEEVYDKRKDAISELGAVYRCGGMCDFTPYSPPGKAFYKLENQKHVLNLPQFVNPFFDEKEHEDRIEEYGSKSSVGYKVFVKGEVVEDGVTALDMKRIRDNCYLINKQGKFTKKITTFEITKENFKFWKNLIVVRRPENAERIWISTDVGKRVTEIIVHSEVDEKYEYIYNITLLNLTQQEVEKILYHMIQALNANYIATDCGDGEGRGIYSGLELKISKERLIYYDGSMKIKVGYEYDENEEGEKEIQLDKNGEIVYKYELMADWSVKRLKDMLYDGNIRIPKDLKFDRQFSAVIETVMNGKIKYKCICTQGDHLFDSWKVFSIAEFIKSEFCEMVPDDSFSEEWGSGACSN